MPKVVDFGISKSMDGKSMQLTSTDAILGTPFYMSPEQAMEAKNVDARTDQFSLGVILYDCVTGQGCASATKDMAEARRRAARSQKALGPEATPFRPPRTRANRALILQ